MPTTIVLVVIGVAVVCFVLFSRMRGERLNARRLVVLPAVLTVIGLVEVLGAVRGGVHDADLALLAGGLIVSTAFGIARGATVMLYAAQDRLWLRYRPLTLVLWLVTIAVRVGLSVLAAAVRATLVQGPALLLFVGVTLLGEGSWVVWRARSAAG